MPTPANMTNNREAMIYCVFRALRVSREDAALAVDDMINAVPALARIAAKRWTGRATPADSQWLELLRKEGGGNVHG